MTEIPNGLMVNFLKEKETKPTKNMVSIQLVSEIRPAHLASNFGHKLIVDACGGCITKLYFASRMCQ